MLFGLGMWHDSTEARILYVHVGTGRGQKRCPGKSLAKLCCQLQFLEVGRSRGVLLRCLCLMVLQVGMIMILDMDLIGNVLVLLVRIGCTVTSAGMVEWTSIHRFRARRRIADIVGLVRLSISIRAHGVLGR